MSVGTVASNSVGQPAFGVIQNEGMDGPDVWFHALMLSWKCFRVVRDERPPTKDPDRVEFRKVIDLTHQGAKEHYDALKNLYYKTAYALDARNRMPIHPAEFLEQIARNHINAGIHFGYYGRFHVASS